MSRLGLLLSALVMLLGPVPAAAQEVYGTKAWSLAELTLRQGPGAAYHVRGTIPAQAEIRVERCQRLWCYVRMGHTSGWTSKDHVGFGLEPEYELFNVSPDYPSGGPGEVCFFTGTHFSGASICYGSGHVVHDLLLYGLDDVFASVRVEGSVSAAVCRDRDFQSYCTRIVSDTPVLTDFLLRDVSSIRVY